MGFGMFCVAATRGCINMYLNKLIGCQSHRSKVKIMFLCVHDTAAIPADST